MLMPGDDPRAMTQPDVVWNLLARWVKPGQAELERAAAAAVLVRPDRYVFDACARLEQAGEMISSLSRWLATGR